MCFIWFLYQLVWFCPGCLDFIGLFYMFREYSIFLQYFILHSYITLEENRMAQPENNKQGDKKNDTLLKCLFFHSTHLKRAKTAQTLRIEPSDNYASRMQRLPKTTNQKLPSG